MAQKSNLLTIRKKNFIQIITHNTKVWVVFLSFLENINRLFYLKNVSVCNYFFGTENNLVFLELFLYFNVSKKLQLEKKIKRAKFNVVQILCISKLLKQLNYLQRLNFYIIKLNILNTHVNVYVFNRFYSKIKFFLSTLFARRYKLFIDFLQFASLFFCGKINLKVFISVLGRIFQYLSKRLHGRFLSFLKAVFGFFVETFFKKRRRGVSVFTSSIRGIKFLLNGKFRGKNRSTSKLMHVGQIPTQSISKNIVFDSCFVHTLYGAFGLKIWLYKTP
jgi:hypothetical protein